MTFMTSIDGLSLFAGLLVGFAVGDIFALRLRDRKAKKIL